MTKVVEDPLKVANYSSLKNILYDKIYRHSGYYAPIFEEIELFAASTLTQSRDYYKFDTDLTHFGKVKERISSKINRKNNILKLRNNGNLKSQYPMLDEFGYQTTDFFIFKSSWDYEYHIECKELPQTPPIVSNQSITIRNIDNNTNNNNLFLL
jgi:hypothetical protein